MIRRTTIVLLLLLLITTAYAGGTRKAQIEAILDGFSQSDQPTVED
ncbi:MAG: hypothetical protein V3V57_00810 [Spirochaetia bacterium]